MAGLSIDEIELASATSGDDQSRSASARFSQVSYSPVGVLGSVAIECPSIIQLLDCTSGKLTWQRPGGGTVSGQIGLLADGISLNLGPLELQYSTLQDSSLLKFQQLPVGWLPGSWTDSLKLQGLEGRIDGQLQINTPEWQYSADINSLSFDTEDGSLAGAELGLSLQGRFNPANASVWAELTWKAGEALLGPLYLPAPEQAVTAGFEGKIPDPMTDLDGHVWLSSDDALDVTGNVFLSGQEAIAAPTASRINADLQIHEMQLDSVWAMGLDSLGDQFGLGGLKPSGSVNGGLSVGSGALQSVNLAFEELAITDQKKRLSLGDLTGELEFARASRSLAADLKWQDASVLGIELGPSQIHLHSPQPGVIELDQAPFRVPVFDGELIVHQLRWQDWMSNESGYELDLDLELKPIPMARVSQALGLPPLGGQLSGRLPGISLNEGVIQFDGGIDIAIFSGTVQLSNLQIERAFGPLPALAADIELNQLDLYELTGAFDIGSMSGRMSGYVRELRLLNWQPTAFDAWFATDTEISGKRRISQQAVDSISSLSGGAGAVLSNTIMRIFDDFPYEQVGLGCRLSEQVCLMRGLKEMENRGYLIVEGRGLPHLDIIGYQRRVDWSQLINQIGQAVEGGVKVGESGSN